MRTLSTITTLLAALVIPVTGLAAATRSTTARGGAAKTATRTLSGEDAQAGQWGTVQVVVTLTTTGSGKDARKRYTNLGGQYTYHTSRSEFVMSQALPVLRQEFLTAQSAHIQLVSGATNTSEAFEQSLQSALLRASS